MIILVEWISFWDGFEKIVNIYYILKKVIEDVGYMSGLGDEGGFVFDFKNLEEVL